MDTLLFPSLKAHLFLSTPRTGDDAESMQKGFMASSDNLQLLDRRHTCRVAQLIAA